VVILLCHVLSSLWLSEAKSLLTSQLCFGVACRSRVARLARYIDVLVTPQGVLLATADPEKRKRASSPGP
jgi:hypothetical protein